MKYRHRMTLYKPAAPVSDFVVGESQPTEVAVLWAGIETASGSEVQQGDGLQGKESVIVRFRWAPLVAGINSSWWATRGAKRYQFVGVANVDERNKEVVASAIATDG